MKRKIVISIGILFILIGIVLAVYGIWGTYDTEHADDVYEDIKAEVKVETPILNIPQMESGNIEIPIDFEKLTSQYPDVYAWIVVPGTNIDYPIVQRAGDNSYYLNHTIDGQRKTAGSIYTEDYNAKDFQDPNTVIYGHNMKNGSMFKTLHRFRDKQFFDEHREIIVYQENKILTYKIFAAYVYDNRHLLLSFDYEDENIYRNYLNNILTKRDMSSNIDTTVGVTEKDRIITLSTCTGNDATRYLVQGVLLSIQEK